MNEQQQTVADVLKIEIGQCYTFEPGDGAPPITWSIDMALKIIGNRPPMTHMPPFAQREALERNDMATDLDMDYAMKTDLTKPLIAVVSPVEFREGQLVLVIIDGWHRIKHSVAINNPNPLPVHILIPIEEEACRITPIKPYEPKA